MKYSNGEDRFFINGIENPRFKLCILDSLSPQEEILWKSLYHPIKTPYLEMNFNIKLFQDQNAIIITSNSRGPFLGLKYKDFMKLLNFNFF